jgi:hypothetical protein
VKSLSAIVARAQRATTAKIHTNIAMIVVIERNEEHRDSCCDEAVASLSNRLANFVLSRRLEVFHPAAQQPRLDENFLVPTQ